MNINYLKTVTSILILLSIYGCSAKSIPYSYRPESNQNAEWLFQGEVDFITTRLTILINGTEVITGNLSIIDLSGEFQGEYQGSKIDAECEYYMAIFSPSYEECIVSVDGKEAAIISVKQPGT